MDDFILLTKTKQECIMLKNQISNFIEENLGLELNSKSRYYPYKMGVNFCGYRIFLTHKLLRLNSKKKIKNKIKRWNRKYCNNNLDINNTMQKINSWIGHTSHCDSYRLRKKILSKCKFLYTNETLKNDEKNLIKEIESQN